MPRASARWSPWLVAAVGLASMLIALSFAEVGSRFDGTGGPYLYTRAAFGRFAAFEVGWMMWFTRAASWAAVINVLATALGFYWPSLDGRLAARRCSSRRSSSRSPLINIRGIRQSSLVAQRADGRQARAARVFIVAGALLRRLAAARARTGAVARAAVGDRPAADLRVRRIRSRSPCRRARRSDPRRAVPFALIMTIVIVTIVMTLVQVVALGTLPGLARVEDAARRRVACCSWAAAARR